MIPQIEIENLTIAFGDHVAVDGVSLAVGKGEAFGLVGESGSGKSTVLRCLVALSRFWTGNVRIAGTPLRLPPDRAFYRQVQMVFQDPYGSLHPRRTVHSTLAEPVAIHRLGDSERRIAEAMEQVGLGPQFLYRYPHQLSGGQRQRVAIARALIVEPSILLLDEPTSALDVSVQAEVLNLLADIRAARGLTYLLVSHDIGVIDHLCDRVAVMKAGRIVETLRRDDLRAERTRDPYTANLLGASAGYDRGTSQAELETSR